jgi:hypothetical protein
MGNGSLVFGVVGLPRSGSSDVSSELFRSVATIATRCGNLLALWQQACKSFNFEIMLFSRCASACVWPAYITSAKREKRGRGPRKHPNRRLPIAENQLF